MIGFLLWENHATGPTTRFGPHVFLVACVAARLGLDRFELLRSERFSGRSCNGNSNVLRELGRAPLWDTAPNVVAVLDSDKLHDLLGGEARNRIAEPDYSAWSAQMEKRCRARLGARDTARLTIHFLDRNLESLLEVLGGTSLEKDVVERDRLLQRAAADPTMIRRAQTDMPSWASLVDTVASWIEADRVLESSKQ